MHAHVFAGARVALGAVALLCAGGPGSAADPVEPPRFGRHVVPVFSKLGCNAGACHGAVNGQNGFRLSLFGANPAQDHAQLLREFGGRRLNRVEPEKSLLLQKATGEVPHAGGARTAVGSREYRLLRDWIARGAPLDPGDGARVTGLKVSPPTRAAKPGDSYQLEVEATFADGSTATVTDLCTFAGHDKGVATVDPAGRVLVRGVGDTAVVVRFGATPTVAHLFVPRPGGDPFPDVKPNNFVDRHVLAKLRQLNLPPADPCDDATFLRRAALDATGALPDPDEVRAFLADPGSDKRAKKVAELLGRPGHTALWATKFCDTFRVRISYEDFTHAPAPAAAARYYDWVRARLRENTPYDELVARMVLGTSLDGRSRDEWIAEVVALLEEEQAGAPGPAAKAHADRRTLDLYWHRFDSAGVKGAIQFGHQVLGLRLQCAECHRHPSDVWTQDDLLSFANFFMRVRANTGVGSVKEAAEVKKLAGGGLTAAEKAKLTDEAKTLQERAKALEGKAKEAKGDKAAAERLQAEAKALTNRAGALTRAVKVLDAAEVFPTKGSPFGPARATNPLGTQASDRFRFLGAATAVSVADDRDPRELLVEWLRKPDNPYFSRAIVNRVWAHYFGRGLVDPADDLSPLNPPTHPELLQELCDGFVRNKYDLKWLHATILNSRTYQQSSRSHPASATDTKNYASFYPRRLMAEVVVDALNRATGSTEKYSGRAVAPGSTALEIPFSVADRAVNSAFVEFAFTVLGRPLRSTEAVCDCERESQPSLGQALLLANHPDVWKKIQAKDGRLAKLLSEHKDDDRRAEEIFLWTLGRPPTARERKLCVEHVKGNASAQKGFEGVMWSLINSKEFVLNH